MISAEQAKALSTVNSGFKTQTALRSLESRIADATGDGHTSLSLIARDFPKDQELLADLRELGYVVTTLDRADGDWELTLDWSA